MPPTPINDSLNRLNRYLCLGVSGGEGIHVGEDEVAGAVMVEGGFVFFADDGEGVQHVLRVVFVQAVEVEVERVEAGAQVAAFFFVPDEGLAVVAEVTGSPNLPA